MRQRTIILAVVVFIALAVGLTGYVWSQQEGSEPPEEARQETDSTTGVAEETGESSVAGTEGATTVAGTEGATTVAGTEGAAVEQTDVIDEASLAEASPQAVLGLYYSYLNGQAWEEAYGILASQSQQRVSLEQWVAGWQARPSYTIEEYSISPVEVQSDLATLQVDAAVALGGLRVPASSTRQMVWEDGGWRVVLSDREVGTYAG